jgi:predicted esterase
VEGAGAWKLFVGVAGLALAAGALGCNTAWGEDLKLLDHTTVGKYEKRFRNRDIQAWRERVPRAQVTQLRSSVDGKKQRAMWYDSGAREGRPLLVVLHSWSADYEQNLDIPFAEFAIKNDWVFIHPDFRGPNWRPEATASDLAVQDVVDAVAYAREHAVVDADRIYLVGYSGGAMKALVLAGRHPELWAGVAAWGGIYDIPDWYHFNRGRNAKYRKFIASSCGGAPRPGSAAEQECRERSPVSVLDRATGRVPILIAHGLHDDTVPPRHALHAYDALAAPDDRFSDAERAQIDSHVIPAHLRSDAAAAQQLFDHTGVSVQFARRSRDVTLVLYSGGHDMVYNAAVRWLSQQRRD